MDFEGILKLVEDNVGKEAIIEVIENSNPKGIHIEAKNLIGICQLLHTNESTYFDFLSCVTGVDNGSEADTMDVLYHLYSIPYHLKLMLKVQVNREITDKQPLIPTVSHIWATANWHEREIYDLLGIKFEGHPDKRRILMPADWVGHPLRKDYEEMVNYHGIKVKY